MAQDEIEDDEIESRVGTLEVINAEIAARLGRQFQSGEKIDNKSVVIVGYGIAAASFLATRHVQPVLAGLLRPTPGPVRNCPMTRPDRTSARGRAAIAAPWPLGNFAA